MAVTSQDSLSGDQFASRMADLLTGLVRGLVDQPDALRIDLETTGQSTAMRLYVAPDDLGKVIGKQGRTARSLRTILNAIGNKAEHRISLDVLESSDENEADEG